MDIEHLNSRATIVYSNFIQLLFITDFEDYLPFYFSGGRHVGGGARGSGGSWEGYARVASP